MKTNHIPFFLILNIVIPILIGAVIYYLISPGVIFVQKIDSVLGKGIHMVYIEKNLWGMRFVRNYLLDMLWAYALVFAVYFILGNNTAGLLKSIIIALLFSSFIEFSQLTTFVHGTFDVLDIGLELLAEVAAVVIIKHKLIKGGTKET